MIHKLFLWLVIQQKRAVVRDLKQELDYHITTKPAAESYAGKPMFMPVEVALEYQEWRSRRDNLRDLWRKEQSELHLLGG